MATTNATTTPATATTNALPNLPSKLNGFHLHREAFKALAAEDGLQKQRQYVPNPREATPQGDNLCNTQRVVRQKRLSSHGIHWAIRELLQNTLDHCEKGIDVQQPGSVWYSTESSHGN